ncbi:MAG: hypothetical protein SFX19_03730 [Alphaproteobacteria bacterium]|nr:hypothetical protein [Alphaproteobacteria bacterium]
MQKKENIVRYTMDEVLEKIARENIKPGEKFYTMTDAEIERLADEEDAEFVREDAAPRRKIIVHLDGDLVEYMHSHHLNVDNSVNAALRQYVSAVENRPA